MSTTSPGEKEQHLIAAVRQIDSAARSLPPWYLASWPARSLSVARREVQSAAKILPVDFQAFDVLAEALEATGRARDAVREAAVGTQGEGAGYRLADQLEEKARRWTT